MAAPDPPKVEEAQDAREFEGPEEERMADASPDKKNEGASKESPKPAEKQVAASEPPVTQKSPQECLYGSVASFYKALKEQEDLDDLQKLEARQGLRQVGSRYLAAFPGAEEAPEVAFNVAWVSYEQGDYKAALEGFKGFVQEDPGSKEASAAGHLVLDIHKSLDDLDGLIKDARSMLANERVTDPKFRTEVGNILAAAEHRELEELTVKVKDGAEGSDEALLALGREAQDSGLQELALFNLFVVSKEAEDIPKVLDRGRQILAKTQDAKRKQDVLATMAHFYFEAGDFPNAASYSEKAAEGVGGDEQADYLIRAAKLRGWMGDNVAAVKNYQKAMPLLSAAQKADEEKELLNQYKELKDASQVLSRSRALMSREPEEMKWVFLYGETLYQQGNRSEAMEVFKKVDEQFARKVASAPAAVTPEERAFAAQARFYRAGEEMAAFKKISIKGDKIENSLIQKKLKAHQAVEAAGLEVAQYSNPRWTIASLMMAAEANDEISRFFLEALELDPGMDDARANLVVLNEGYGNLQKARQSLSEIADRQALESSKSSYVHPDFRAAAGRMEVVAFDHSELEALEQE